MYTLYWAPRTGSLAPQAVLEETGARYRLQRVDMGAGEHRSPAYLLIQPNGLVPAMLDADGTALFESAALVMTLCDRHPEAGLAPRPTEPGRGLHYQWLLYMADTLYPAYQRFYYSDRFSSEPGDGPRVREKAGVDLLAQWRVVDDVLAERRYLLGEHAGACDIYMMMLATWFEPVARLLQACPNVARCTRDVAARPAVHRALDTHGQLGDLAGD